MHDIVFRMAKAGLATGLGKHAEDTAAGHELKTQNCKMHSLHVHPVPQLALLQLDMRKIHSGCLNNNNTQSPRPSQECGSPPQTDLRTLRHLLPYPHMIGFPAIHQTSVWLAQLGGVTATIARGLEDHCIALMGLYEIILPLQGEVIAADAAQMKTACQTSQRQELCLGSPRPSHLGGEERLLHSFRFRAHEYPYTFVSG